MKSTTTNGLNYTGIVSLSQYTNHKKTPIARIYNNGGNALFNFLSDCLVGDFDSARITRPTKIMLLNTEYDGENENKKVKKMSSASGFIYLISKPEKVFVESTTAISKVCYSFVIARDTLENATFNSIGLFADNATLDDVVNFNYAAFCDISLSTSDIAASSLLAVDWELNISNK